MDRSSPRRRTAVAVLVLALAGGVPVAPSAAAAPAPDAAHPADATGRADGAHPAAGSHPVGAAGASLRARLERARLRPRPPRTAGPPRHLSGPDVGTVTGVVTDAAGRPAAGLLVGAVGAGHDGGGGTAVSDADGRYTVTATAGRYLLSLLTSEELLQYAPAARVPAEAHVYPVRAGRTLRVDVTLLPIGQISGRVTYPDGRPVRHELVVGWQVDGPDVPDETTATDDQGHFALRLFGGRYRLAVAHPEDSGMQFVPGRRRPEEGTVFTVGTDTTAVVTETLRDHGSLHGRITDVTGAPSGGLEVVVEPRGGGVPLTATTGGDGVFRLPRVMHGDYVVRFRPSPHTWWRYLGGGATPDGARTITVSSGRETAVVGSVSGGGRVEVRPLAADGRPVAGFCAAWAEPVEGQQFTRCTDDAALTLDDLPPGPVRITVRPGTPALLLPGQDTATVTRGATVRAAPRLAAGGGVRVAVTARATGAPVGDVSVLLVPAAPGGQP
ncbi:MAG TPA: carboxypeptidase-like regulatory domain-containing protein, partial [Pilimelia sp.]|nr:carboxypeptidase-like regulatory domain-containing protein [Pilimelia sp.]